MEKSGSESEPQKKCVIFYQVACCFPYFFSRNLYCISSGFPGDFLVCAEWGLIKIGGMEILLPNFIAMFNLDFWSMLVLVRSSSKLNEPLKLWGKLWIGTSVI